MKIPGADTIKPTLLGDANGPLSSADLDENLDEEEMRNFLLETLAPEYLHMTDVQDEKASDEYTEDVSEHNAYLDSLCDV